MRAADEFAEQRALAAEVEQKLRMPLDADQVLGGWVLDGLDNAVEIATGDDQPYAAATSVRGPNAPRSGPVMAISGLAIQFQWCWPSW
ncbi:hypothetical protein SAMN05421693_12818 [Ectothiorhodospira magna]|uniref:Uncharacterized protein n=1 Tax=Ectothiorhodospira magna TaxID=867345 RepID=A0A1H9FPF4_9GAMM|nr:hypothetical protein SAMN05421693_12818 [Ectothiorhodospira magna]